MHVIWEHFYGVYGHFFRTPVSFNSMWKSTLLITLFLVIKVLLC